MMAFQANETKETAQRPVLQKIPRKQDRILVYVPNTEIIEREDYFHLLLDMPGLEESSIEISCEGSSLTVSGVLLVQNYSTTVKRKPFQHTFYLPQGINDMGIEAQFFEGTLQISVLRDDAILHMEDLLEAVLN